MTHLLILALCMKRLEEGEVVCAMRQNSGAPDSSYRSSGGLMRRKAQSSARS